MPTCRAWEPKAGELARDRVDPLLARGAPAARATARRRSARGPGSRPDAPPGRAHGPRVRRRLCVLAGRPPYRRRPGARAATDPSGPRTAGERRRATGNPLRRRRTWPARTAAGWRRRSGRDRRSAAGGGCRREHSACPPPSDRRPRRTPAPPRTRVPAATRASSAAEARHVERRVVEREPAGQVGLDRQLALELVLQPQLLGVVALLALRRSGRTARTCRACSRRRGSTWSLVALEAEDARRAAARRSRAPGARS